MIIWRSSAHFTAFSQKIKHELRDIATGNGNMFDSTSDHIALRTRNDVGDTVTRVDDCAG